jgi:hypothetical protein
MGRCCGGGHRGALDPAKFWVAWDRGLRATRDTFRPGFDLWEHVEGSLEPIRASSSVVPLDPIHAGSGNGAAAGFDYRPIVR